MKNRIFEVLLMCAVLMMVNCIPNLDDERIDYNSNVFQGTEKDIENFYTPEAIDSLKSLGLEINTGNNPPNVQGIYISNPNILVATNLPDEQTGNEFLNVRFAISNQNNDSLTIDFHGYNGIDKQKSIESFISGNQNKFTIYLKLQTKNEIVGSEGIFGYVFSGTKTNAGIENLSIALMMLDDSKDFANIYIDNNQGRRFIDSDGIAELLCPIGTGNFNGTINSLEGIFHSQAIRTLQRDLRMPINEGTSPPYLSGNYSFNPILKATTRTGQDENLVFENLSNLTFSNRTNNSLQIDFDGNQDDTPNSKVNWFQGVKSYISGSGNRFSVYSKCFLYDEFLNYQTLSFYILSGTVSSDGQSIQDFVYGLYMINDAGDIQSKYIENGEARYFIDNVSQSARQELSEKAKKIENKIALPSMSSNFYRYE